MHLGESVRLGATTAICTAIAALGFEGQIVDNKPDLGKRYNPEISALARSLGATTLDLAGHKAYSKDYHQDGINVEAPGFIFLTDISKKITSTSKRLKPRYVTDVAQVIMYKKSNRYIPDSTYSITVLSGTCATPPCEATQAYTTGKIQDSWISIYEDK